VKRLKERKITTRKLVHLYTDGACRGNGSRAAQASIAVRILDENGRELERFGQAIGLATNNQAEYRALIKGLELATKHTTGRVDCYSDSQLVVSQMIETWKVNKKLRPLWIRAAGMENDFDKVTYDHLRQTSAPLPMGTISASTR
jgi:ribonuclease HI